MNIFPNKYCRVVKERFAHKMIFSLTVFDCADGRCADKCDSLADLPEDLLVTAVQSLAADQEKTLRLLDTYREKVWRADGCGLPVYKLSNFLHLSTAVYRYG